MLVTDDALNNDNHTLLCYMTDIYEREKTPLANWHAHPLNYRAVLWHAGKLVGES